MPLIVMIQTKATGTVLIMNGTQMGVGNTVHMMKIYG